MKMTLLKSVPTAMKTSPTAKTALASPTRKSPPTMKKSFDVNSPLKKPTVTSALVKSKTPPAVMKPSIGAEKLPAMGEKLPTPNKVEKSPLKSTVTKTGVNLIAKTTSTVTKSPTTKNLASEAKTPVRIASKATTASKTLDQKQLDFKKDVSVRSLENLSSNKTNVNSMSLLKTPTRTNSSIKNTSLSPVKSVSSPVKLLLAPVKSISSPVKSISSPVKSISSPVKSVSSPVKSVSSPVKSVSSPVKSVSSPVKSVSSSVKSITSPIKSSSSPVKPKLTCEVKSSSAEKAKDVKTNQVVSSSLIKKPISSPKSSIKSIQLSAGKTDNTNKSKIGTKNSPTSKIVKNSANLIKIDSERETVVNNDTIPGSIPSNPVKEKLDLCRYIDTIETCEPLSSTPLITEYALDNSQNFDVVQAFKVAEQLIKIQSNERNLETIIEACENNSVVNWDDVITPCDNFDVPNAIDKDVVISMKRNDTVLPRDLQDPIFKQDSCIIEMSALNYTYDSKTINNKLEEHDDKLVISLNRDENQNIIEFVNDRELSTCSESTKTESNDDEYFISSGNVDESNENNFCHENVLPEWTVTIDEFSLDLSEKENQSSNIYKASAEKENFIADQAPYTINLSYADALKKTPKVLTNSTNAKVRGKEPKKNIEQQIKGYRVLKKAEVLHSTDIYFHDIENDQHNYGYDDLYEEPEYCEIRKKKHKKIKHFSKRHSKTIYRDDDYIENHSDIFVTQVWKNIY